MSNIIRYCTELYRCSHCPMCVRYKLYPHVLVQNKTWVPVNVIPFRIIMEQALADLVLKIVLHLNFLLLKTISWKTTNIAVSWLSDIMSSSKQLLKGMSNLAKPSSVWA